MSASDLTAAPTFLEARLENGLRVIGERDPDAQTVALGYFVQTGARDEAPEDLGASHFIEHLLFKGSEHLDGRTLNARLDALGGNVNAFTSEETTVYHAATLPEHGPELLGLLSELLRPAFREADVEAERGVILEEIAMYADDPASRVYDELRARAWGEHPLGHLVLGTEETVSGLTAARLRANFEARYGTRHTTLVACGAFDWDALIEAAERETRTLPRGTFTRIPGAPAPRGGLTTLRDDELLRTQFALLAPGFAAAHPKRDAAVVLADLLGGDHGRLYWSLVNPGLADGVDFGHVEFDETGTFEGSWSCDPARAQETLDLALAELRRVQREGVTPQEVARSRKKIAVGTVLRAETPYARLFALGMDTLYLGRGVSTEETVARFEAVTVEDVEAVLATRPFDEPCVVSLGPGAEG